MATLRIFQGTEDSIVIDATNDDGTPIGFQDQTVDPPTYVSILFVAFDKWNFDPNVSSQIFSKLGSLRTPHSDIVIDDAKGELTLWIRAADSSGVSNYAEWSYYVELDPGDGSGPYPLDSGDVCVRPRPITPNQAIPFDYSDYDWAAGKVDFPNPTNI